MKIAEMSRIDARLTTEQKELFEYAATLGGYRTLTEFLLSSAQEKATSIVQEHETLLASKRDQEIFFDALVNPPRPNARLKKAAKKYAAASS